MNNIPQGHSSFDKSKEVVQNNVSEFIQSSNLKRNLYTLILVFIALFLISKTVLTYKEAVSFKNPNSVNYISVSGKAEEYIKPDTLTFYITVNEEGKNVSEATAKVTTKVNQAIAILTANGVSKDNVKLEAYNVSDKYENVSQSCESQEIMKIGINPGFIPAPCQVSNSKIVGQIITQSISVKIRDIEKNANNDQRTKILGELTAQNIKADNFAFTVYDIDIVKKEIREMAIKNAKEDAKKLAKDLGVRLDQLSSFSDNNGDFPIYGMGGDAMNFKSARVESAPVSAPELTPGQQKVISNVTLTYSIK
jgi:uncharacterized protein YggE